MELKKRYSKCYSINWPILMWMWSSFEWNSKHNTILTKSDNYTRFIDVYFVFLINVLQSGTGTLESQTAQMAQNSNLAWVLDFGWILRHPLQYVEMRIIECFAPFIRVLLHLTFNLKQTLRIYTNDVSFSRIIDYCDQIDLK